MQTRGAPAFLLVGEAGFEPATIALSRRLFYRLSYTPGKI
jgi:hypothetical protein